MMFYDYCLSKNLFKGYLQFFREQSPGGVRTAHGEVWWDPVAPVPLECSKSYYLNHYTRMLLTTYFTFYR